MTLNEYQAGAMRTAGNRVQRDALIYAALALVGEAGEFSELVKKHVFHGHPLDMEKAVKELGDAFWGLAYAAHVLGVTLDHVGAVNLDKLRKRYPDGFSEAASRGRTE